MDVRRALDSDREQLIPLIRGYFDFYETPFPLSRITALLHTLAADETLGVQLVAEEGERLLGFASLYACVDTLVAGRVLVMNDLFVSPAARRSGIGASLLRACREYADKAGYLRLDWVTANDNLDAQRFYEREGAIRGPWVSYSLPIR
jgi:GNAT superfamily N-acetyltransferase